MTYSLDFVNYIIDVRKFFPTEGVTDGVTDVTTYIQNAVNSRISVPLSSAALGVIYFPRGTYKVTAPITLPPGRGNQSSLGTNQWRIVGDGPAATTITGNVNGFIFDTANYCRFTGSISGTTLNATAIEIGNLCIGQVIRTVDAIFIITAGSGGIGTYTVSPAASPSVSSGTLEASNSAARAYGYSMEDLSVTNNNTTPFSTGCVRAAGMFGASFKRLMFSGMVGFTTEDSPGNIYNGSQCYTLEHCYHSGGSGTRGFIITGDSHVLLGCDVSGSHIAVTLCGSGHQLIGCHFEVNTRAIALGVFGNAAFDGSGNLTSVAMAGYIRGFSILAGAYEGNGTAIDFISGVGYGLVQGPVIQGEATSIEGVSTTSQYGIRIRDSKSLFCSIIGAQIGGDCSIAGIYLGENSGGVVRTGNVIQGVQSSLNGGSLGSAWAFPTATAEAAAGYTFIGNNSRPSWTFSNLPIGGNIVEGDRYRITDGASAKVWGDIITVGGGSTHYGLEADSAGSWRVVAK